MYICVITVYVKYIQYGNKRCTMDIIISNSGGVPIYDQITRQMKGLILIASKPNLAEKQLLCRLFLGDHFF